MSRKVTLHDVFQAIPYLSARKTGFWAVIGLLLLFSWPLALIVLAIAAILWLAWKGVRILHGALHLVIIAICVGFAMLDPLWARYPNGMNFAFCLPIALAIFFVARAYGVIG